MFPIFANKELYDFMNQLLGFLSTMSYGSTLLALSAPELPSLSYPVSMRAALPSEAKEVSKGEKQSRIPFCEPMPLYRMAGFRKGDFYVRQNSCKGQPRVPFA